MPINYLDHLPDRFTADAVDLYLNAFKGGSALPTPGF